jgi:hypothetical protein
MNERHATFANCPTPEGTVTFRVGQPTDWSTAQDRWLRLDNFRVAGRARIHYMRRSYPVASFEVRATDRHGRGLGSDRHARAITVPYRSHKAAGI